MTSTKPALVLVDDDPDSLHRLAASVERELGSEAVVRPWYPDQCEDLAAEFETTAGTDTILVVADYDLTRLAKGFFGHSVVAWCQRKLVPVGDFSRGQRHALATEPDLFHLRVPTDEQEASTFIARMFDGFRRVRKALEEDASLAPEKRSPAQVLAALLGRPSLESQMAPYLSRPSLFNSSLLDELTDDSTEDPTVRAAAKEKVLTYILGHVLVNAVLKYPGPILGTGPLCAYLSTSEKAFDQIASLFEEAAYIGPFDRGTQFFWRDKVDSIIDRHAEDYGVLESPTNSFGDYHRTVLTAVLGETPRAHDCTRCKGLKGGFWCPFTNRPVCELSECSSGSSSWVPSGAYACRVERDFYDEWSPILSF